MISRVIRDMPHRPIARSYQYLSAATAALTFATGLAAQSWPAGEWLGTFTVGSIHEVTYRVTSIDSTLSISLHDPTADTTYQLIDIELLDHAVTFQWNPGAPASCQLLLGSDGTLEGPCETVTAEATVGRLRMIPPSPSPPPTWVVRRGSAQNNAFTVGKYSLLSENDSVFTLVAEQDDAAPEGLETLRVTFRAFWAEIRTENDLACRLRFDGIGFGGTCHNTGGGPAGPIRITPSV